MNKKIMLEAKDLVMKYEENQIAVDNVNFKVCEGEIFAMLGGNGAGKTTTINMFLNLIEPTSGDVLINGISAKNNPLEAKKYVSFVSENVMLYQEFTALQNLDFFSKLAGKNSYTKEDYQRVLKRVGLQSEAFNRKVKEYSKGMRQKCGIAISILKDAPVILLDEPTSGLDPKAGKELMDLLFELKTEGKAILMSTHDIFRSKDIADKVGIMNSGKLVLTMERDEFINQDLEKIYVEYMSGYMDDVA